MSEHRLRGRLDPREVADRLLHEIDTERIRNLSDRVAVARVLLRLAEVDEERTHNIIDAIRYVDLSDFDKTILKAVLRRELKVLPMTADGFPPDSDGGNGGH